jgi:glycosyltransferase involved in cell wall biosynthesis
MSNFQINVAKKDILVVNKNRQFVLHRNDVGIPSGRKIEVIEIESRQLEGYPEISVIIPTADGCRDGLFPALLKQLSEQAFQNFETIIIKGDSRQGRAINTGADIARGRYLLTLDDDTSLASKDAFEKLAAVIENNVTIGMAGGINVIPPDASWFVRRAMQEIPRRSTPPVDKITDSDLAEHPLLIIRREIFVRTGGENELIPRGLDPYLRQEFRKAGYRVVVVPRANYSHLPPKTLFKMIKQFYRNGKQAAFCNKFYPQWVFETPEAHVKDFVERRPYLYRAARYGVNMVKKSFRGHWIYFTVSFAYAIGYMWGYMRYRDETQA